MVNKRLFTVLGVALLGIGTVNAQKKVEPLCATEWGQDAPYNNMCPEKDGKRCVTGCVVTATAQVMRYHKHPAQGSGSASYTWEGQTLQADFSKSVYQWDKMLPKYKGVSYSEEQGMAVALLMRDLGYATEMPYNVTESGTASTNVPYALWHYFGYDKNIVRLIADYCSPEEFEEAIRHELDEGRPVLMNGSDDGGHVYVCDGYNEQGLFHINYGWEGSNNNYYRLGKEMPYSKSLEAHIGIQPDKGGKGCVTGHSGDDFKHIEGDQISCGFTVNSEIEVEDIEVGLAAKNTATGDVQYFTMLKDKSDCAYLDGVNMKKYQSFRFDKTLPDGQYQLYPVCRMVGDEKWQTIHFTQHRQRYIDLTVTGGKKTYANNHIDNSLDEGKVEVDGIYYLLDKDRKTAAVTFRNNRYGSYKGAVTIPQTVTVGGVSYDVTQIAENAFHECYELTSLVVGSNVQEIKQAFYDCFTLTSVTFQQGSKLQKVAPFCFQDCRKLAEFTFPEGTTEIGINVFEQCTNMRKIVLPASITMLADNVFVGNSANVDAPHLYVAWQTPLEDVGEILNNYSKWTLHVPQGTKQEYQKAKIWKEFGTIVEDSGTDIQETVVDRRPSGAVFDLQGRRVDGILSKGIYVINGKKVVIE